MQYAIYNVRSGQFLGIYDAANAASALDVLAIEAGYESYAEACAETGDDDLSIVPVTNIYAISDPEDRDLMRRHAEIDTRSGEMYADPDCIYLQDGWRAMMEREIAAA